MQMLCNEVREVTKAKASISRDFDVLHKLFIYKFTQFDQIKWRLLKPKLCTICAC